MKKRLDRVMKMSEIVPQAQIPEGLSWLNTSDNQALSFERQLKGKFVVVDFWSSCCINCIHMLAEIERLKHLYADFPEVAFIGSHSAKFKTEKNLSILRQALLRYDIRHPVVNDNQFKFWSAQGITCWPTVMVFGPDAKPLFKMAGEGCEEHVSAILQHGLQTCVDQIHAPTIRKTDDQWISLLNSKELPVQLETEKSTRKSSARASFETVLALR